MGLKNIFLGTREWNELLEKLKNQQIPSPEIGSAIVKLGKPFDKGRILAAKDVVASYLNHEEPWVRREAMWFLTSWGGLQEYSRALIHALQNDPLPDNRAYAASSLGVLFKGSKNSEAIKALRLTLEDTNEEELVRKYAYRSLLQIAKDEPTVDFPPHERQLSDIDWQWVTSIAV